MQIRQPHPADHWHSIPLKSALHLLPAPQLRPGVEGDVGLDEPSHGHRRGLLLLHHGPRVFPIGQVPPGLERQRPGLGQTDGGIDAEHHPGALLVRRCVNMNVKDLAVSLTLRACFESS
jgi:hypothetical protein